MENRWPFKNFHILTPYSKLETNSIIYVVPSHGGLPQNPIFRWFKPHPKSASISCYRWLWNLYHRPPNNNCLFPIAMADLQTPSITLCSDFPGPWMGQRTPVAFWGPTTLVAWDMGSEYLWGYSYSSQPSPWPHTSAPAPSRCLLPPMVVVVYVNNSLWWKSLWWMWGLMKPPSWATPRWCTLKLSCSTRTQQRPAAPFAWRITKAVTCSGCCLTVDTSSTSSVSIHGWGCTQPAPFAEHLPCQLPCLLHWLRWCPWQPGEIDSWRNRVIIEHGAFFFFFLLIICAT